MCLVEFIVLICDNLVENSIVCVVDWVEVILWGLINCWLCEYGDNMLVYYIKRIVFFGEKFIFLF